MAEVFRDIFDLTTVEKLKLEECRLKDKHLAGIGGLENLSKLCLGN